MNNDPITLDLQRRLTALENRDPLLFHTHTGIDMNKVNVVDLQGILPIANIARITLTPAQINALKTTPQTLIAAQGSGSIIIVDAISAKISFNTVAYTGANNLEFRYTNGSGTKVTADMASAFLDSGATAYDHVAGIVTELTPASNAAIVVAVPTADPGAGNSNITFVVRYRVISF